MDIIFINGFLQMEMIGQHDSNIFKIIILNNNNYLNLKKYNFIKLLFF